MFIPVLSSSVTFISRLQWYSYHSPVKNTLIYMLYYADDNSSETYL